MTTGPGHDEPPANEDEAGSDTSNIATTETNIEHVAVDERDGDASTLIFDLQVRNRKHLAQVIKNLRKMPEVLRVTRMLA